jgi:hypothetical protein
MPAQDDRPCAGETVVLTRIPPGLLDGLSLEDRNAIEAVVGTPVLLVGYDDDGRAELMFDDPFTPRTQDSSHSHTIWVAPAFIRPVR